MVKTLSEITCPISGELIDVANVDSLVDAYERTKNQLDRLNGFMATVRVRLNELVQKADDETITYRLRGERRRVKLTLPDLAWDQASLKQLVVNFPVAMVAPLIQVSGYKVAIREWRKLATETGGEEFTRFKAALEQACRGRQGLPTLTIEE